MNPAQLLLRRLLEDVGGAGAGGFLLVLEHDGLADLPSELHTPAASWAVSRVETELGLRALLFRLQGAPLIAVLPQTLAEKLLHAPDVLRRARHHRVHSLSVHDVLEVVLGTRVVGIEAKHLQELAMEHLDKLEAALARQTRPTVIDRRLLTELLVDASVGEQVRTRTAAQLLAGWIQDPPHFTENVGRLVRDALPVLHGDEGRLLAWALDESPERRLRELVVRGAVMTVEGELPEIVWGKLYRDVAAAPIELPDRVVVRRVLASLATATIGALEKGAASILDEASTLARKAIPSQVATSTLLPLAFDDRARAIAKQASKGLAIEPEELAWLSRHFAAVLRKPQLALIEAMARLTRWLAQPKPAADDVLGQVRRFQQSDAFADLAMLQLRRALAGCSEHHAETAELLRRCHARRDEANLRFAQLLAANYEGALHTEGLTPLHRLWKRTVAPLWSKEPAASLYVVVLDGCSYAVFLELVQQLCADPAQPIGLQPDADGRGAGLPALAPLPTVTSHARGALFLGELPKDPLVAEALFRDQDEAKTDPARFAQNHHLGKRSRRLFLKGELGDGGQALRAALADGSIEVVAAVFNAVDDQIGSTNTSMPLEVDAAKISGFKASLIAAFQAKRRVLLTADHGHSLYIDKTLRIDAGKAPRWLPLPAGSTAPEGFLEIDVAGLGGPPERRAFAWRSGVFLGGPQVGFHGGCSLEEMVVPLAFLEQDGLVPDEPGWWFGKGSIARAAPETLSQPPQYVTPTPVVGTKPKAQLSLFDAGVRAANLNLPAGLLQSLQADETSILVLLSENRQARASELAEQLGKNPGRLNGLLRQLRRKLHAAGVVLFTDEVLPSGEVSYRWSGEEPR